MSRRNEWFDKGSHTCVCPVEMNGLKEVLTIVDMSCPNEWLDKGSHRHRYVMSEWFDKDFPYVKCPVEMNALTMVSE
ncbi:hypothetical protein BgiMline_032948, partial [Biomphalaria glabrata]